jgi:uncharacterized membrane protein YdbT with pleckstrin-like domain
MTDPGSTHYDGEKVLRQTKLHWVALIKEILYTLGLLLLIILVATTGLWNWLIWLLLAGWAVASFRGVTNWFTTTISVSNRRVMVRQGLLSKKGYEIPIDRVQDVAFRQSALQRMFGAGDLLVESGASDGRTALRNVPDPEGMKRVISEAREARIDQRFSQAGTAAPAAQASAPAAGASRVEQLEILAKLHEQGSLSDEEFAAEKARLMEEG